MKRFLKGLLLTLVMLTGLNGFAIDFTQVKWSYEVDYKEDGNVALVFNAIVDSSWHLYAQEVTPPHGTEFVFNEDSSLYTLVGATSQPTPHEHYDETMDKDMSYFEGEAQFVQLIKPLSSESNFTISGDLYWMSCQAGGTCIPPQKTPFEFTIDSSKIQKEEKSYLGIFLLGFGAGLLALLTPCVFPMIPMTVTFFTKQSKTRAAGIKNALLYGMFIIVIYVGVGLLITKIFGASAMYNMATNPWFNLLFFVMFMIFAFSFLGAFELTLPSSWVNKSTEMEDKGGLIGIFFMAFTLALVSFSCTGPFVGTILVEAAQLSVVGPAWGMFGFAAALALPFTLFALFPGWLNSLPSSGGWLNSVKVVLGLAEVGLAFKFLSNADLAWQWWFLTREVFIAIWIVVCILIGMYLLGKLKFSHDSDLPFITVPRIIISILFFAFAMYLIPGMFGAPLKMISGFPPPSFYSEGWSLGGGSGSSGGGGAAKAGHGDSASGQMHCPQTPNYSDGLPCFHDYEEALAYAKEVNKPLLVDFTGWTCVNCRWMEENMWVRPGIEDYIGDKYVLVSLYVDDMTELPDDLKAKFEAEGKDYDTYGDRWLDMEGERYGQLTQPLYVALDHNEEKLVEQFSYTTNESDYKSSLQRGLDVFKKRHEVKEE